MSRSLSEAEVSQRVFVDVPFGFAQGTCKVLLLIRQRVFINQDAGRSVTLPGKREGKGHCLIGFIVDDNGGILDIGNQIPRFPCP